MMEDFLKLILHPLKFIVKLDIIRSGSIYSIKKSDFNPSQRMTWLGYDWDTEKGTFAAASHRVEQIKNTVI